MALDETNDPRWPKLLRRLETFLDVSYALLFMEMLRQLPRTEEFDPTGDAFGILRIFIDRPTDMLRVIIGVGLVIMYWGLSHHFTGPLVRSDSKHATLVLMQLLSVCFFIYFAIADPNLEGGFSSPALQALALVIAGAFGIGGYQYARRKGLVDARFSEADREAILFRGCVEPVTAILQVGTAFLGPLIWTLGWFLLPIPVKWLLTKVLDGAGNENSGDKDEKPVTP